jgi:hypothetical protein
MQITVVGGTYREHCQDPPIDRLLGSGMRAAGLLTSLGDDVEFLTAIDDSSVPELKAVSAVLRVSTDASRRTDPITFGYETPLHPCTRQGRGSTVARHVTGENVLLFGMIEAAWTVHANRLVIDPQHGEVADLLTAASAGAVTLILNEHEARRAAGNPDAEQAAIELLGSGIEVVVVKRGALGGVVAHRGELSRFGALATTTVHPVGSGDAFTAGYAHAWIGGADPLAAARFASRVAGAHSLAGTAQLLAHWSETLPDPLPYPGEVIPRIYLAGPFFNVAQRALIRTISRALTNLGAEVFSPLDEIGHGGDEVAAKDLDGLAGCHSVLAVLDGHDPGTLFEVGWATHAGIPVTGLAEHPDDHGWTMLRGTGSVITGDLSSAAYHSVWSAIRASTTP